MRTTAMTARINPTMMEPTASQTGEPVTSAAIMAKVARTIPVTAALSSSRTAILAVSASERSIHATTSDPPSAANETASTSHVQMLISG